MNPFKHALCLPAILAATLVCAPAQAALLTVSCSVSTGSLSLNYDPDATSPTRASGDITLTCNKMLVGPMAASVTAVISLSQGSSSSFKPRTLKSGSNSLLYNIYTDSSYSLVWGDGTNMDTKNKSDTFSLPALQTSITKNYPYYIELPKEQNVRPGTYIDTITVTVSY